MVTIAADDRLVVAEHIRDLMGIIDTDGKHFAFDNAADLLALADKCKPDIVWLDIEMPDMNGLEAAVKIKELSPLTNIVFVTGHPEYAVDAFGLHVSGFVLKPVTPQKILDEISALRQPPAPKEPEDYLLRVQCFGNFEVFANGRMVKFSRALSKEALAYLVDRKGAACTVGELCAILWEDRQTDKNLKSQCRVILGALKKDLAAVGAGGVIVKDWNNWAVDAKKLKCDYYDFLKGSRESVNTFRGEYMSQYSWAEMTVGMLFNMSERRM